MGMRTTGAALASLGLLVMAACGGAPPRAAPPASASAPAASAAGVAPVAAAATAEPAAGASKAAAPQGSAAPGATSPDAGKKARGAEPPIVPCAPDSAAYESARQAFEQLDAQMEALAPDADPEPANRALAELLDQPCFRIGEHERPQSLTADTALALKTFWQEGGRWWVSHYLELGASRKGEQPRESVVPPAMRRTLTKELRPAHPLADLLCSVKAPSCGQLTRGWARRAQNAFRTFVEKDRWRWSFDVAAAEPPKTAKRCGELVKKLPRARRYTEWRACIEEVPLEVAALPLGGTQVPKEGWLVIRGRRGHYSFCDEIRAYDLATGAAFVVQSCSGLVLRQTGRVDHSQTDAARQPAASKGWVPLDNLREAAWMILFAGELDKPGVRNAEAFAIPDHVPVSRPPGLLPGLSGRGFGMSSAQTRLSWSYLVKRRTIKRGSLTWPFDYNDAGKDHAVGLLRIAEDGFVKGCPPARLPAKLDLGTGMPGVSHLDATRRSLSKAHQELVKALEGLRKGRVCRGRRR